MADHIVTTFLDGAVRIVLMTDDATGDLVAVRGDNTLPQPALVQITDLTHNRTRSVTLEAASSITHHLPTTVSRVLTTNGTLDFSRISLTCWYPSL